jgi:hypothetical protein
MRLTTCRSFVSWFRLVAQLGCRCSLTTTWAASSDITLFVRPKKEFNEHRVLIALSLIITIYGRCALHRPHCEPHRDPSRQLALPFSSTIPLGWLRLLISSFGWRQGRPTFSSRSSLPPHSSAVWHPYWPLSIASMSPSVFWRHWEWFSLCAIYYLVIWDSGATLPVRELFCQLSDSALIEMALGDCLDLAFMRTQTVSADCLQSSLSFVIFDTSTSRVWGKPQRSQDYVSQSLSIWWSLRFTIDILVHFIVSRFIFYSCE